MIRAQEFCREGHESRQEGRWRVSPPGGMTSDIRGAAHIASCARARDSASMTVSFGEAGARRGAARPVRGLVLDDLSGARPALPRPEEGTAEVGVSWAVYALTCLTYRAMSHGDRHAASGVSGCPMGPTPMSSPMDCPTKKREAVPALSLEATMRCSVSAPPWEAAISGVTMFGRRLYGAERSK